MSTSIKLTLEEYEQLIAAGAFQGADHPRVELIGGELIEMSPIGTRHAHLVSLLIRWSLAPVDQTSVVVHVQSPLAIPDQSSMPEPDLTWLTPCDFWNRRPRPQDVSLLIEVADTSLECDRRDKAALYAQAGIEDYWIVNIPSRAVEVHREPQRGRYRSTDSHSGGDVIHPLRFPDAGLTVSNLFPPE